MLTEVASGFPINSADPKFITFWMAKPSDIRFLGLKDQKYSKTEVNSNEHVININLFYNKGLANKCSYYFISVQNATPLTPLPFS
jgi:hypothetical protein